MHVIVRSGGGHDPGSYVRAFVDSALETPECGPELRKRFVERLGR